MHKDAGRPWPVICAEDDVTDYMVMEAVQIKVNHEEREARKRLEREEWKKSERKRLQEALIGKR